MNMYAAVMTLARYEARQIIKKQLYARGIKLQCVEAAEITKAADQYIDDHPEFLALAAAQYRSFVERGLLKPPRNRRKATQ
jgi:hypothetical protein